MALHWCDDRNGLQMRENVKELNFVIGYDGTEEEKAKYRVWLAVQEVESIDVF